MKQLGGWEAGRLGGSKAGGLEGRKKTVRGSFMILDCGFRIGDCKGKEQRGKKKVRR